MRMQASDMDIYLFNSIVPSFVVKQLHLFLGGPYTQDPLCFNPGHWTYSSGLNWCPEWLQ